MPLQNRVAATGEILAVAAHGLLTGNRGVLHRRDGTLGGARWRRRAWICCRPAFRDRYHGPMPPGGWTALFLLDEATALAAGHRPCGTCRRAEWQRFLTGWAAGHGLPARPTSDEIDRALHAQRIEAGTRGQRRHLWSAAALPDGAMIEAADGSPLLILGDRALPWSFAGYGPPRSRPSSGNVVALTPPGTLRALTAGYRPLLHPTAGAAGSLSGAACAPRPCRGSRCRAGARR